MRHLPDSLSVCVGAYHLGYGPFENACGFRAQAFHQVSSLFFSYGDVEPETLEQAQPHLEKAGEAMRHHAKMVCPYTDVSHIMCLLVSSRNSSPSQNR